MQFSYMEIYFHSPAPTPFFRSEVFGRNSLCICFHLVYLCAALPFNAFYMVIQSIEMHFICDPTDWIGYILFLFYWMYCWQYLLDKNCVSVRFCLTVDWKPLWNKSFPCVAVYENRHPQNIYVVQKSQCTLIEW